MTAPDGAPRARRWRSPAAWAMIGFIRAWRAVISPLYGNVCRYYPSCSAYGLRAVEVHGAARGAWLIVSRIARCNPFSKGGYDPVPGTPEALEWAAEREHVHDPATAGPTDDALRRTK